MPTTAISDWTVEVNRMRTAKYTRHEVRAHFLIVVVIVMSHDKGLVCCSVKSSQGCWDTLSRSK